MKTQSTSTKQKVLRTLSFMALLLAFGLFSNPLQAQDSEQTISGLVMSTDGPVFGATIVLKGTNIGVVSNEKGEFTFPQALKTNDILVVSYLGLETDEVQITGDTSFIKPFLADIPVIIRTSLRTKTVSTSAGSNK